ncbi:hypothetical protein [Streptomyces sp. DI166]|uniref:hypothetical protein n=1 Tax=Streptomyces sp. DI166 TaxID=1839783 RepID=UPI000B8A0AC5|nr:hypothetical protein [Streptomyces sp. DI166]
MSGLSRSVRSRSRPTPKPAPGERTASVGAAHPGKQYDSGRALTAPRSAGAVPPLGGTQHQYLLLQSLGRRAALDAHAENQAEYYAEHDAECEAEMRSAMDY